MSVAVFSSSWMRANVDSLASDFDECSINNEWAAPEDWVEWMRQSEACVQFFTNIADTPRGYDFVDDCGEITHWIDTQPDGTNDCGYRGAIYALYIVPVRKLQLKFAGAMYALAQTRWLGFAP